MVVLSARGNASEIERALTLGACDYLVKSATTADKVVERIEALLRDPGRPAAQMHYRLHVQPDRGDAERLGATFFGDASLTCAACGTSSVLDLTPEHSHSSPAFTARLVCPSCSPSPAQERKEDGADSSH